MKFIGFVFALYMASGSSLFAQSVVINELMYAPSTPEPEWVELYHSGATSISAHGWTISDAVKTVKLPDFTIEPNGYILLTKDSIALSAKYSLTNTKILKVTLPTFNNDADLVVLKDSGGAVIDSISYAATWGGTSGKSLERIDDTSPSIASNFASSIDPRGATPSSPNSIRRREKDVSFIHLVRITSSSEDLGLQATIYNGGRSAVTDAELLLYHSASPLPIAQVGLPAILQPRDSATIDFTIFNADYGLDSLTAIVNASGDELHSNDTLRIALLFPALPRTLVFNELMNQPTSASCEWVELYNQSSHTVDLVGCILRSSSSPSSTRAFTLPRYRIPPRQFILISANDKLLTSYPELAQKSGVIILGKTDLNLNTDEGILSIQNPNHSPIDSIHYLHSWYGAISGIGVSLERRDLTDTSQDAKNWGACLDDRGATPLARNSLNTDSLNIATNVSISIHPNPFSPDGDGFEDVLDIDIAIPDENEHRITAKLYDARSNLIAVIVSEKRMIANATITYDGKDINGRTLPIGLYTLVISSDDGAFRTVKKGLVIAKR